MKIFEKLFVWDSKKAFDEIFKKYIENWFLVVNYLYFANLIWNWIIWNKKLNEKYLKSLENWDFLLPDWIALRLYIKKHYNKVLENLNGTDFSEFILRNLNKNKYNLILYWSKSDVIKKASKNIENKFWIKIYYFQDWYSDFDFSALENIWNEKINILMIWLWTPKQEIWTLENIENIKKYNLLTFTQWWTFDFWAGNEKRAPKIFIKLKLEWLWRFITNPKKNFKKVLNSFWLFWHLR